MTTAPIYFAKNLCVAEKSPTSEKYSDASIASCQVL